MMMSRKAGFDDSRSYQQAYRNLPVYSTVPYVENSADDHVSSFVEKPQHQQHVQKQQQHSQQQPQPRMMRMAGTSATAAAGGTQQTTTSAAAQPRMVYIYPEAKMTRSFPISVPANASVSAGSSNNNNSNTKVAAAAQPAPLAAGAGGLAARPPPPTSQTVVSQKTTTTKIVLKPQSNPQQQQQQQQQKQQSPPQQKQAGVGAARKFKIVAAKPDQDAYLEWSAQQNSGYTDGYGTVRLGGLAQFDQLYVNPKMILALESRTGGAADLTEAEKKIKKESKFELNKILSRYDWEAGAKRFAGHAPRPIRGIDYDTGRPGSKKVSLLKKKNKGGHDPLNLDGHLRSHRPLLLPQKPRRRRYAISSDSDSDN